MSNSHHGRGGDGRELERRDNRPEADRSSADQIKSFVERIERLQEEKDEIASDMKDVYAEAKAHGFDTKILRKVIAIRKMDKSEREEMEAMLELYMSALGML